MQMVLAVEGVIMEDTKTHVDGTRRPHSLLLAEEGVIMEDTRTHAHGTPRPHSLLLAVEGVIMEDTKAHADGTRSRECDHGRHKNTCGWYSQRTLTSTRSRGFKQSYVYRVTGKMKQRYLIMTLSTEKPFLCVLSI